MKTWSPCLGRVARSKTLRHVSSVLNPQGHSRLWSSSHFSPCHRTLQSSQIWFSVLYAMYCLHFFTLNCHKVIMLLFQCMYLQQLSDLLRSPPRGLPVFSGNYAFKSVWTVFGEFQVWHFGCVPMNVYTFNSSSYFYGFTYTFKITC